MASRTLELSNAIKERIQDWWAPSGMNAVVNEFAFEIDSARHEGRKVYLIPATEGTAPATRGLDQEDFGFLVMVVERFGKDDGQGDPPQSWTDARVRFTESLFRLLSDPRQPQLLANPGEPDLGFWPELSELVTVYDADYLLEKRLYLGVISLTYRGEVAPTDFTLLDIVSIGLSGDGFPRVTTTEPHGLTGGELVSISGTTDGIYDGEWTVGTVLSETQFRLVGEYVSDTTGGTVTRI